MKTTIRYGLIGGLLLVAFTWAGHLVFGVDPRNFERQEIYGYASMILALSVIFFAVLGFREQVGGGEISFGKGLQVGVLTGLVSATIYFVYMMVYFRWIAPEFMSAYTQFYREKIADSALPTEEIAAQLAALDAALPMYTNASFQSLVMFATVFVLGVVVAVVSAAVLRKQR